jgi:hypothetical protein
MSCCKIFGRFHVVHAFYSEHGFESNRIKLLEQWDTKSGAAFDEESLKMLKAKADMILLYGELLLNQCLENPQKEQPLGSKYIWIYS